MFRRVLGSSTICAMASTGGGSCSSGSTPLLPVVLLGHAQRRCFLLEATTKGNTQMRHLDLYARRDPQLAPYLLREVDVEFKRRCRKVNFVIWVAITTVLLLYDERLTLETFHFLKHFAEQSLIEQDKRDEDSNIRRQKLIKIMNVVKDAFMRDQQWTDADAAAVENLLDSEEDSAAPEEYRA